MKFKKDGKVFEDIDAAHSAFKCPGPCNIDCPLSRQSWAYGRIRTGQMVCDGYVKAHPAEAARLMGYEVVEEEKHCGQCKHIDTDKCDTCGLYENFEEKEANMDKQKPLKDWTLGEVQEFCQNRICSECPHRISRAKLCKFRECPSGWDLTEKPRFTEQEVEDARAIMRLFSKELWTTLKRCVDDTLWVQGNGGAFMNINNERFKSLLPGDSVNLSDIVGGTS